MTNASTPLIRVNLAPMLDIQRAREVYALLDEAVQGEGAVELDASGVERVDTAGFQVLIAFCRTLAKQHRTVALCNPSEALLSAAQVLGVENHLPVAGRQAE